MPHSSLHSHEPIRSDWAARSPESERDNLYENASSHKCRSSSAHETAGKGHCHNVTRFRKGVCLDSVLDLQFFDKFCGNVLDNLTKHCHIMFLRTHVCLRLVAENKVACVLGMVGVCQTKRTPPLGEVHIQRCFSINFRQIKTSRVKLNAHSSCVRLNAHTPFVRLNAPCLIPSRAFTFSNGICEKTWDICGEKQKDSLIFSCFGVYYILSFLWGSSSVG